MIVFSPIFSGSGAEIFHQRLGTSVSGYGIQTNIYKFPPRWEYFPWGVKHYWGKYTHPGVQCDIVHTFPEYGCFFKLKKVPLLVTIHHCSFDQEMLALASFTTRIHHRWILKYFAQKTLSLADQLIAVSQYTKTNICEALQMELPIQVVYLGIDAELYCPPSSTMKPKDPLTLFFSGNPSRRKGFDLLDPLMRELGIDFQLRYTTGLRGGKSASLSSPNAHHLGVLPEAKMVEEIQGCDIALQPSRREGFGLSILEAMSCGKPVVSSYCSAIPEVVEHEKGGYLCEPGSVSQLAKAIRKLAQSPELRQRFGNYNRKTVLNKFTQLQMAASYRQIYSSLGRILLR
jgi:glycosyltransferase involved in cell wall biosynthesis